MIQNAGLSCLFFFANFFFSSGGAYDKSLIMFMEVMMIVLALAIVPGYLLGKGLKQNSEQSDEGGLGGVGSPTAPSNQA